MDWTGQGMGKGASGATALLARGVDELLALDLSPSAGPGDDELLGLVRSVEAQVRRLAAVDRRLVAALESRGVARRIGMRSTSALLRRELRISAAEARNRAVAATPVVSRADEGVARADEGDEAGAAGCATPGPDLLSESSGLAQARGELSAAQLRAIRDTLDDLPPRLRGEHADSIERELVAQAGRLDPCGLASLGAALVAAVDPEALRRLEVEQHRRRTASLVVRPDGSGDLRAALTPEAVAFVQAALLPLAAPAGAARVAGAAGAGALGSGRVQDPRTPGQRLHDGLVEACRRLLCVGAVPGEGGVPATVIVTVPLAELRKVTGTARSQYGGALTIAQMLRVAGEAGVVPVVVDARERPLAVGRSRRFATRDQTYALIARDGGCSFPDCDHPPAWTQRHHVRPWARGGRTDVDEMTLLCPFHHANFESMGWTCVMVRGRPRWIPPAWVDPQRRPRRNHAHDRPETDRSDSAVLGVGLQGGGDLVA